MEKKRNKTTYIHSSISGCGKSMCNAPMYAFCAGTSACRNQRSMSVIFYHFLHYRLFTLLVYFVCAGGGDWRPMYAAAHRRTEDNFWESILFPSCKVHHKSPDTSLSLCLWSAKSWTLSSTAGSWQWCSASPKQWCQVDLGCWKWVKTNLFFFKLMSRVFCHSDFRTLTQRNYKTKKKINVEKVNLCPSVMYHLFISRQCPEQGRRYEATGLAGTGLKSQLLKKLRQEDWK